MIQDIRYGARMLIKARGFTAVVVTTLALGIGANTAIFSVINAILLRPLPYPAPDRLVMLRERDTNHESLPATPADFRDWRDQNTVFAGIAVVDNDVWIALTGTGEPEKIEACMVSPNFFSLLGIQPALGRGFLPDEDQYQNGFAPVILSHRLWQRRFGSDPELIGKTITIESGSYSVVGIMPRSFQFLSRETEMWVPLTTTALKDRENHGTPVVARLKPNVSPQQAQAEMDLIACRLEQQYPATNTGIGVAIVPLQKYIVGEIRPALLVLLGAVGLVLLLACANIANLLLARAAGRQKEIAIRLALGAGRGRVMRQLLTESMILAGLGGTAGLLFAVCGIPLLVKFMPDNIARVDEISVDAQVLGFTLAISLAAGLLFGSAPAWQASKLNLNETLKVGGRGVAGSLRQRSLRSWLVAVEVALALVLLIGAGLMIKSFLRLREVNPGFGSDHLLTLRMAISGAKYNTPAQRSAFYDQMLPRVEAIPGVQSAGLISFLPLTRNGICGTFIIAGRPALALGQYNEACFRSVSPDYFRTMSIPVRQGRPFAAADTDRSTRVAIINQTMARRFWPHENPISQQLTLEEGKKNPAWLSIIGVVGDVRQFELERDSSPELYVPYTQAFDVFVPPFDLVVKTVGDPISQIAAVRSAIWAVDKDQPITKVRTVEQILSESVARPRFNLRLLGIFAGVALLLAAIGIYGVMAYSVTQRTREIGVRIALGAQPGDVLKLVLGEGLKLALAGVTMGVAAALAVTRVLTKLLYGVSPTDPAIMVGLSLLLVAVVLAACYLPARRAMKVDPMIALRYE